MALVSPAQEESPARAVPSVKGQKTETHDKLEDVEELDENFFSDSFSVLPPEVNTLLLFFVSLVFYFDFNFAFNFTFQFLYHHSPPSSPRVGGATPEVITDKNRPILVHWCNLALDKYNAENKVPFLLLLVPKSLVIFSCIYLFILPCLEYKIRVCRAFPVQDWTW